MEIGNENARIRMESDRISSLPDDIIHLILSSLDIKYAIQTSVLSSRWKLIWTTLPYLNFSTGNFRIHNLQRFSKFVDHVLSQRNNQAKVHAIDIYINGSVDKQAVYKIANYAVSHNVQKVCIWNYKSNDRKDPLLPLCLFSSQSLKDLYLRCHPGSGSYFLPQSPWDSPALTAIKLDDIWLCANNTMCLDLFSKCVNLMNLTLSRCKSYNLKLMKIVCPRLLHLTISHCLFTYYFEIFAPNLKSFCYEGSDTPPVLYSEGFSYLEKVNLYIRISGLIQGIHHVLQRKAHDYINLLHKLNNARFITLTGSVIVLLSKVLHLPEHQHSPFFNLKCLSVEGVKTSRNCPKSDLTSQVTNYLWNSSRSVPSNIELPEVRVCVGDDEKAECVLAPLAKNVLYDVNDEIAMVRSEAPETGSLIEKSHKDLMKSGKHTASNKGVIGGTKRCQKEPLEVLNVHDIEVEDSKRERMSQEADKDDTSNLATIKDSQQTSREESVNSAK